MVGKFREVGESDQTLILYSSFFFQLLFGVLSLLTPGRRSLCFDSINQYFSTLGNRVSGKNLGQRSLDIKVMGLGWATAS